MLRWMLAALLLFVSVPAWSAAPGERADRAFKKKDDKTAEEKTEEERKAEEEEERKKKELLARVLVLKWPGTSADYMDETLRRNVRSRIARPEAMFFPDVDLYQNGRKVPDRTVIPANQPAVVPDSNVPSVLAMVDEVAATPWNAMAPDAWGAKAEDMRNLADALWFVDRVDLREPLFKLYIYTGYAADNANNPIPPFYESIGGMTINYYYYLAAQLAYQEPALLSKVTDQDIAGTVNYYFDQLNRGTYPVIELDFDLENEMEESFDKSYEVLINGLPVGLDENGRYATFLGRTDIYMQRKDTGHGLSERLEVTKLEDKAYFVREVAHKRMGIEFIDQLFLNPNACLPDLDGDILTYIAIYQKLHPKADIFVAVPNQGKVNDPYIWSYNKNAAHLKLISGGTDGFPVRFVLMFSSGLLYSKGGVSVDDNFDDSLAPGDVLDTNRINPELDAATLPFDFELRGHWNRLMVNLGAEFGKNIGDDADQWVDYYQTPGKNKEDDVQTVDTDTGDIVFHTRNWNRTLYLGAGVVMGPNAGIGQGPRIAAQWGWMNLPHSHQPTLHFGWAAQPPVGTFGGRFRPLVDLDLRAGANIPYRRSLRYEYWDERDDLADAGVDDEHLRRAYPVFGATLGVGFSF